MILSTIIGTIVDGTPTLNRVIDGEKFNTIIIRCRGVQLRLLFSEYVHNFPKEGKVKVTGCLMSDIGKQIPQFYFYTTSIVAVDDDVEEVNEVNFTVTVNSISNFNTDKRCREVLSITGKTGNPLRKTSLIYLHMQDKLARRLKDTPKDTELKGTGYLKNYKDIIEILVTSISE